MKNDLVYLMEDFSVYNDQYWSGESGSGAKNRESSYINSGVGGTPQATFMDESSVSYEESYCFIFTGFS